MSIAGRPPVCDAGLKLQEAGMLGRLTVLVALTVTVVSANAAGEQRCALKTLKGRYVFAGRGFIEALEPGVQRVHYGVFEFDGAGKVTGRQSSSRGGRLGREKLEGTYTLEADCSGTMTFSFAARPETATHWDMYVTSDGRKGNIVRMDEGNMAVRSFEK
jgi:hypothetical protein